MAEFFSCNRLTELWMLIDKLHLSYLHTDENLSKIEQRGKLEGYIKEYLCLVPHERKFSFRETAEVLHESAAHKENFSGYRAALAWNAIAVYAANLLAQPWRKEYKEMKLFCGYYKHEIEANLAGAELMLKAMGYKHVGETLMVLDGPIDPDRVSSVSRDSIMAYVECQLLKNIWEDVSRRFTCSWLEVLQFRENHVGTPENAAKGIVYHFYQRRYEEQQQQLVAYHPGAALDTYGTAARLHQPVAGCVYGQVQPVHTVPHMGYFNCSPYPSAPTHTCTLPPQPRYAGVASPQQALPPTVTYPVPAMVHPAYHHISGLPHQVLKSQDLYPTDGHHPHHHCSAPTVVTPLPLQNGYSASNHLQSAPPPVQNFSCPVPTGQLIELDVAVPPHSGSDESRHTYSAVDSASSVLIPRTVNHGSSQHPSASLRNNSEREYNNHRQQPQSHSYSTSFEIVDIQPLTSGKAKEDGIGTYKSWDYVFRNLESQGYSKDQGARPDILSSSPELMAGNSISRKNHVEDVRNSRHNQSPAKNLEETLMELRLEEFQKPLPIDRRPLKINEALQKIYMETGGETCQGSLSKRASNVDTVDGSRSVYDNLSSPPKDNPERERPVTTVLPSSKSNGSFSAVNNKESARTLPRNSRKYVEERQRATQAGTHYSSTTLNPRHLQDVSNHYQHMTGISDSSPPDRIAPVRDSTSKVRVEERQGSIVDIPFDYTRESSEVSEKSKWECVTCTFLNVASRDICEMCGKSKVRGPEVRPLASGGRECPQCTLVNEKGVGTCEACGNSLKDSPTYI